jgi:hypothetical protein
MSVNNFSAHNFPATPTDIDPASFAKDLGQKQKLLQKWHIYFPLE